MSELALRFPSLTLFSDLDWDEVTQEYETHYANLSFPEYLQQKALEGDCPPYLFELAYFELALGETRTSVESLLDSKGLHLNPTALFLSLEFDVKKMLAEAAQGRVQVIQRPHVLCLFRGSLGPQTIEMSDEDLTLLQLLEDGPLPSTTQFSSRQEPIFDRLKQQGLILDLTE